MVNLSIILESAPIIVAWLEEFFAEGFLNCKSRLIELTL